MSWSIFLSVKNETTECYNFFFLPSSFTLRVQTIARILELFNTNYLFLQSWCLVYRLSTCKIEFFFIPGRHLALLYHLLEYLNQGIWRKREVGNASFSSRWFHAAFLSCSLPAVAHSIFLFHLHWWLCLLLHCCKFLAEPSPTHNFNFPVSAISSNNSPTAGCAIKNQGCVCLSEHIMLQTKQPRTLPSTAILVVDANSLVLHLSSQGNCVPEVKYLSDIIDKNKTFKLYTLSQIVFNFKP